MRRVILSIVAIFLATFSLQSLAQQANTERPKMQEPKGNPTLEGIWQLCKFQKSDSGQYELHVLPVVKTVASNGAYSTILLSGSAGGCGIVGQGTYAKENDTTLVETPLVDPRAEGEAAVASKLVFHLQGPQWMVLDRPGAAGEGVKHEIWMRLRVLHNGSQMLNSIINENASDKDDSMRPDMGKAPGRGKRQGGAKQKQNNNSQSESTSPIDESWMNEN